jgi:hypothetical protein
MTPEENQDQTLPFRSDFAARVLDAADAIAAQRSRTRWAITSVAVAAGLVTYAMWQVRPVTDAVRVPLEIASVDLNTLPASRVAQMEPLDFLFPDATPLSQFSDRYADGDSADAVEDDLVFFPNADEDAVVDGS